MDIASIVLAGGRGVRMNSDLPKVLQPLKGKPLIQYVIDNLNGAGIEDVVVVVGYRGDLVVEAVGDRAEHVWQHDQLGTGHAVMQARERFEGYEGGIVVACGDVPLIRPETFAAMADAFSDDSVKAVVLTMDIDNPQGYGRVVKDETGAFQRIVEEKDANEEERFISEVNTGTYVFESRFLFEGLGTINTDNAQNEYYLPDVLTYILDSGFSVKTVVLENPIEGSGINTKEELQRLEAKL